MAGDTFSIVIDYSDDTPQEYIDVYGPMIKRAADWWNKAVVGRRNTNNSLNTDHNGLVISFSFEKLTGQRGSGGTLGQAGPRSFDIYPSPILSTKYIFAVTGEMTFNTGYYFAPGTVFNSHTWTLQEVLNDSYYKDFYYVILHEMGHVLGIGTFWDIPGIISSSFGINISLINILAPNLVRVVQNTYEFIGPETLRVFHEDFPGHESDTFIRIENGGGSGTAGAHWDEEDGGAFTLSGVVDKYGRHMEDELMGGWASSDTFISRITLASLYDIGYVVDYDQIPTDIRVTNTKENYLKTTKQMIRQAIIDKGIEVPASTPFREYANKIDLIEEPPFFSLTINSGSDAKFILPLKYGSGTAHHDLIINWGDGIIDTITGTAGITVQYQGLTHDYPLASAEYTIKLTGTTYLETAENSSYYGLGFHIDSTGYNAAANKIKVIAASGSPDNLLSDSMTNKNYCYRYMFNGCVSLITTSTILPATTLASQCYDGMFYGCTSLLNAPVLSATTLANYCYRNMFYNCTSLINAPSILPATTLASQCYDGMFYGCTSLVTAPELPATTLAVSCYIQMFYNCSSLITAPVLPATTLTSYCYYYMFQGCTSLITAPELPATTLTPDCYGGMFNGCTSLITAPVLPATTLTESCYSYMFQGCTSLTAAPVLPATTLANYCYHGMFYNCSSLITAPELSATIFADNCYSGMFQGCTSLNGKTIKIAAAPTNIYWIRDMFNLKSAASNATLYLNTTQAAFNVYNVTSVKGSYTNLLLADFSITINSGSDSQFILPLKYGEGTAHHDLTIDWGDTNTQTITGQAGITTENKGLTHIYPLSNTLYTIKLTGTTYLETAEHSSYYGFGFYDDTAGYNADSNKVKVISTSGSPDNLLSVSMPNKDYCYAYMFINCTSLTTAPELPAIILGDYCYAYMFYGCTSLINAPELSATTLTQSCYASMFYDCISLIGISVLPATTLANYCYSNMFRGCYSLAAAPELPATILNNYCYYYMFWGCTSLINAPELPATTLAQYCYSAMFYGCTSLTTASVLPATTLAQYCYSAMFYGCTSLTTASVLPATTLDQYCYQSMFYGCTSLTSVPELPATILNFYCYNYMFTNCTSLITAPELPAITLLNYCYRGMFMGCTSLVTAPELPATYLYPYCYSEMFYDCTSLTTAPELPATTLANYCYYFMFYNCSSLISIPILHATTLATYCYRYMFYGCTSLNNKTIKIAAVPSNISWAQNMFNLKSSAPNAILYLETDQSTFEEYNVASVKGNYTDLINVLPSFSLIINSRSDSKFILPLKYGEGTAHHELIIDWGDSNIQTITGTAGITAANQGLTHIYPLSNTLYTIKLTGTTYLTTTENSSYYGLGFYDNTTGYNAMTNKAKVIAVSGSPDNLLSTSMPSKDYCYQYMFNGCTSLTTAPALPATTLANGCYQNMFGDCISLTAAPELPATTLAFSCYREMFTSCRSLISTPALPVTTLAERCYFQMFTSCSSLVNASALPAITLFDYCYQYMFNGCTSLVTAPALPATILATYCYQYMFRSCTSLTAAPALPATTLATYCYGYMFQGCTSLTAAPELPATILANNCYGYMFYGCTSLTAAPALPATTLANYCYTYMFMGCTFLNGKIIKIAAAPSDISWAANMFNLKSSSPAIDLYLETTQAAFDIYNVASVKGSYTDLILKQSSTADRLEYLLETKKQIKEAIERKNVIINSSDTFRSYVNKIEAF